MFWPLGRVFRAFLLVGEVLFFCGHTCRHIYRRTPAATRVEDAQLLKQRRAQMRRTDEFEGTSVRNDGIEDVLIAGTVGVVVVVDAHVLGA